MRQELCRSLVMVSTLAAMTSGQTARAADPNLTPDQDSDPKNRFGFSYRMGFNIPARFKNLGGYAGLSNAGLTPNGALWNYDNGYNFDDGLGTPPGMTWYWGYTGPKATQVPGDGYLYLSRSSAAGDVNSGAKYDDPQSPGFEITYNRELGRMGMATWGLQGAANYLYVSIKDNRTLYGSTTMQTDAYALNGVIPPDPPYYGTYEGPIPGGPNRPVIADTPTPGQGSTVTVANGATIAGQRRLEADIFGFRVGPYAEVPINRKLSLSLSGGLAVADIDSKFKFNETVTLPGVGSVTHNGSGSHNEWLVGGYIESSFIYSFNRNWNATVGAQYQVLGRSSQQVGGKIAELDLRNSIFVTLGVGYSF